jgi:hypothetical protein
MAVVCLLHLEALLEIEIAAKHAMVVPGGSDMVNILVKQIICIRSSSLFNLITENPLVSLTHI